MIHHSMNLGFLKLLLSLGCALSRGSTNPSLFVRIQPPSRWGICFCFSQFQVGKFRISAFQAGIAVGARVGVHQTILDLLHFVYDSRDEVHTPSLYNIVTRRWPPTMPHPRILWEKRLIWRSTYLYKLYLCRFPVVLQRITGEALDIVTGSSEIKSYRMCDLA